MGHGHSVPGVFRMGFYRDEGSQIKQTVSSLESLESSAEMRFLGH